MESTIKIDFSQVQQALTDEIKKSGNGGQLRGQEVKSLVAAAVSQAQRCGVVTTMEDTLAGPILDFDQIKPLQPKSTTAQPREPKRSPEDRHDARLRLLSEEVQTLKADRRKLESILVSKNSEIDKLKAKVKTLEDSDKRSNLAINGLKDKLRKSNQGTLEVELNAKLNHLEEANQELETTIGQLSSQLATVSQELTETKQQLVIATEARDRLSEAKEYLENKINQNVRKSNNSSREASSNAANADSEISTLKRQVKAANIKANRAESRAGQTSKENARLTSVVQIQSEKIQALKNQLGEAQVLTPPQLEMERVDKPSSTQSLVQDLLRTNGSLRDECSRLTSDNQSLVEDNGRIKRSADFHRVQADTLRVANQQLRATNHDQLSCISALHKANQAATYQVQALSSNGSLANDKIRMLVDRVRHLENANSALKQQNLALIEKNVDWS